MVLYRLLSDVNKGYALVMVALVLVLVAVGFVNVMNNIAALTLFRGADFLAVFDKPHRDALAMLFLDLHSQGNLVDMVFWGFWLFPFGFLVIRSGFLPKILGVWLIVDGFAYLAISLTSLLLPGYATVVSRIAFLAFPVLVGEPAIALWLLIKGAKVRPLVTAAS